MTVSGCTGLQVCQIEYQLIQALRNGTRSSTGPFCLITRNWRGRPLTDRLAVVELIGATTTKTGLKVESVLDTRSYHKGIKVSVRDRS
jgi:hypothetical protein